ncbi:MAG: hypothetical protein ABIP55_13015 [Tepidisphaeraceae bacterium]
MTTIEAVTVPILAARGRTLEKLIEGDPVAWTIFGVVIAGSVGWWWIKKRQNSE